MDDLLSAALSESGLDEYLSTPNSPSEIEIDVVQSSNSCPNLIKTASDVVPLAHCSTGTQYIQRPAISHRSATQLVQSVKSINGRSHNARFQSSFRNNSMINPRKIIVVRKPAESSYEPRKLPNSRGALISSGRGRSRILSRGSPRNYMQSVRLDAPINDRTEFHNRSGHQYLAQSPAMPSVHALSRLVRSEPRWIRGPGRGSHRPQQSTIRSMTTSRGQVIRRNSMEHPIPVPDYTSPYLSTSSGRFIRNVSLRDPSYSRCAALSKSRLSQQFSMVNRHESFVLPNRNIDMNRPSKPMPSKSSVHSESMRKILQVGSKLSSPVPSKPSAIPSSFPLASPPLGRGQNREYLENEKLKMIESKSGVDYEQLNVSRVDNKNKEEKSKKRRYRTKEDKAKVIEEKPKIGKAEFDDELEEQLNYAETYEEYEPSKLRSGLAHPDCVVETASLNSVQPPDIRYHCSVPEQLIDTGAVSALQLEAVIYACQAHERRLPSGERVGYFIGDGAGVGKGRTVACIIFENYLLGRKRALWFSVSADLKYDAERDLHDIGADRLKVYALNKFKYAKISGNENGSVKRGVIFATYSSLIGECRTARRKYGSRLKQLIQWCGRDFDGVIILDECHRAKNLVPTGSSKPTKTGQIVLELQQALPDARIVYASATGASEPRNMAYMTRLGLWGKGQPFPEFSDFINAVERRGVGAMEIVAMDMKQRGLYLARQLSFRGVSFRVAQIPLSSEFVHIYDESVKLWLEARRQFQTAADLLADEQRLVSKHMWAQFWAAHQRFFKYLCIGAKVAACVQMTRDALKNGKCVVIGLQSTGEARTLEQLDGQGGELTDFVSTAKAVFLALVDKHFPTGQLQGLTTDVFRDFDRLLDRPTKRAREQYDDDFGWLNGGKRRKLDEEPLASPANSKQSQSDSDSDSDSDSENGEDEDDQKEVSDSSSYEQQNQLEAGHQKDWFKTLFAEAESSSTDDSDDDKESKIDGIVSNKGPVDDDDDSFNPFAVDFGEHDPWAHKQQVVEDSPAKENSTGTVMTLKKEKKRARKRKIRRQRERIKPELHSEAQECSAGHFLASSRLNDPSDSGNCSCSMMKAELMATIDRLGEKLPPNTLDQLIDELGGPDYVAEMTGRKGRVVVREDGEIEYELRHATTDVSLEFMNMSEKEQFMNGDKLVAIISEAASSGISLQSDRRVSNHKRRVHITLELPWSADKAIQQFGRTHRSNQVSAPEYVFLISNLAGEKSIDHSLAMYPFQMMPELSTGIHLRFASIVAKRLESLGALTHGDRRATESRDLSQFNMDTKYGRAALDVVLRTITGQFQPALIPPPDDYKPGDFFQDMRQYMEGVGILSKQGNSYSVEKEVASISKFLNRLLGIPVHAQNALFRHFTDTIEELVAQARRDGTFDMGIMDLGMGGDQVRKLDTRVFLGRVDRGSFQTELRKIGVERGVGWSEAVDMHRDHGGEHDGFYVSTVGTAGRQAVALVYGVGKRRLDTGARLFCVTRPNTGRTAKLETFAELDRRFTSVSPPEAEPIWTAQFDGSNSLCQHRFFHNRCRNEENGHYCEVGRRTRIYFVLSGSVLSVWPVVEEVLQGQGGQQQQRKMSRMQVVRIRTDQNQRIVGLLIMPQFVRPLMQKLDEHCGRSYLEPTS